MLRPLFKSDLSQLVAIEAAVHLAPWTEETFKACLAAGHLGWVIEQAGVIVAFILVSMNVDECHILNIGVATAFQHQGFGKALMLHALAHAKSHGIGVVYLEVRRSNTRAIGLYKKLLFRLVGVRKGYYPLAMGGEDALVFAKSLMDECM